MGQYKTGLQDGNMKMSLIPVWVALLAAGELRANPIAEGLSRVPEPSSIAMLALGIGAILIGLRGRARKSVE